MVETESGAVRPCECNPSRVPPEQRHATSNGDDRSVCDGCGGALPAGQQPWIEYGTDRFVNLCPDCLSRTRRKEPSR